MSKIVRVFFLVGIGLFSVGLFLNLAKNDFLNLPYSFSDKGEVKYFVNSLLIETVAFLVVASVGGMLALLFLKVSRGRSKGVLLTTVSSGILFCQIVRIVLSPMQRYVILANLGLLDSFAGAVLGAFGQGMIFRAVGISFILTASILQLATNKTKKEKDEIIYGKTHDSLETQAGV